MIEARFVIAIKGERVEHHISAKEQRTPVALRVNHDHDPEVAVELHMVEELVIEHHMVAFRINFSSRDRPFQFTLPS